MEIYYVILSRVYLEQLIVAEFVKKFLCIVGKINGFLDMGKI
jgi:hypothetical protein